MGKQAALADIELPDLLDLGEVAPERVADGKPLKLDPRSIRPSAWANRHEASFGSAEFEELKAEIADAGGNVQPIKVRPLTVPEGEVCYEIVFGHRRHRACLELGLDVAAVAEQVDDQKLWAQMERENRSRANLSAWEQGMMYQRALDAALFPSMLALAKAIGRDQSDVSKAIAIANLPAPVVAAFESPQDIRFRDAKPLKDAVAKAPEAVVKAAKTIAARPEKPPAPAILEALTQAAAEGVGRSIASAKPAAEKARRTPLTSSDKGVGPYITPSKATAGLRLVVKIGDVLMELVQDAKPRKDRIPVRPLGSDGAVQHVAPEKVMVVRVEQR